MPPSKTAKKKPVQRNAKRKPPNRTRAAANARARKAPVKKSGLSELHLDLIGLALAMMGAFMAAVIWGGWNGGPVGAGLADGTKLLVGQMVVLLPALLIVGGFLVVAREALPGSAAVKTGVALVLLGCCLALTAHTFGLGTGPSGGWGRTALKEGGGVVGEALFAATSALVSTLGSHLIAVFLVLGGLVLASGTTVSTVARLFGQGAADATRVVSGARLNRRKVSKTEAGSRRSRAKETKVVPPEPEPHELVVRSTHVEATAPYEFDSSIDDDIFTNPPEPEPEPIDEGDEGEHNPVADVSAPIKLTPMGRYRDSVVDDPGFKWKSPPKRILSRSPKDSRKGSGEAERALAARLVESLGHHGVEAKLIGAVTGPHITRYELQLAPGIKMSKVANLRDDLAYALASTEIRILAPIPGKQAVGVEVPNENRQMVTLGDVWQDPPSGWSPLTVWLGKDVAGRAIGADLAKMPHLQIGRAHV